MNHILTKLIGFTISGIAVLSLLLLSLHERNESGDKHHKRSQRDPKRIQLSVTGNEDVDFDPSGGDNRREPCSQEKNLAEKVDQKMNASSAVTTGLSSENLGQSVGELQEILQSSADKDTKELAAESLRKVGNEAAARSLIAAIQGADGPYRENLIGELRNLSNPAASVPLVETLQNMEDMPLHREARRILLKIDSPVPAQTLVAAMSEAQTEQQRIAIAYTISMLRSQEAIPVLNNAGRSSDELLATRSFMGLSRIGSTNALAALTNLSKEQVNQTGERAEELRTAILRATATAAKTR